MVITQRQVKWHQACLRLSETPRKHQSSRSTAMLTPRSSTDAPEKIVPIGVEHEDMVYSSGLRLVRLLRMTGFAPTLQRAALADLPLTPPSAVTCRRNPSCTRRGHFRSPFCPGDEKSGSSISRPTPSGQSLGHEDEVPRLSFKRMPQRWGRKATFFTSMPVELCQSQSSRTN
ncbi:hypothetical protein QO004_006263 [Rhizobium mesoamericanum]|nr:hypothetical protein [Rhizobium mesoamericanum]